MSSLGLSGATTEGPLPTRIFPAKQARLSPAPHAPRAPTAALPPPSPAHVNTPYPSTRAFRI